jgi:hypothetical protein
MLQVLTAESKHLCVWLFPRSQDLVSDMIRLHGFGEYEVASQENF